MNSAWMKWVSGALGLMIKLGPSRPWTFLYCSVTNFSFSGINNFLIALKKIQFSRKKIKIDFPLICFFLTSIGFFSRQKYVVTSMSKYQNAKKYKKKRKEKKYSHSSLKLLLLSSIVSFVTFVTQTLQTTKLIETRPWQSINYVGKYRKRFWIIL